MCFEVEGILFTLSHTQTHESSLAVRVSLSLALCVCVCVELNHNNSKRVFAPKLNELLSVLRLRHSQRTVADQTKLSHINYQINSIEYCICRFKEHTH